MTNRRWTGCESRRRASAESFRDSQRGDVPAPGEGDFSSCVCPAYQSRSISALSDPKPKGCRGSWPGISGTRAGYRLHRGGDGKRTRHEVAASRLSRTEAGSRLIGSEFGRCLTVAVRIGAHPRFRPNRGHQAARDERTGYEWSRATELPASPRSRDVSPGRFNCTGSGRHDRGF
jgi:hypothetical protein